MSAIKDYAIQCFRDEAQALLDLIPQLTDDFEQAVNLIYQCKGKLIVTGVGKSGHIGAKIAATLASTGTPSFFVNPLDAYHGDLGMFSSDDVVLALSHSGCTEELLRFIPLLLERNIPIISMTGQSESILARYATYHLNVHVAREACPLGLAPTSSTTATLAMGDALAVALMRVRQFKATDFAQFHPGGSLGKKLLSKVKDYMNTLDLPQVSPEDKVSEAIFKISSSKQGIAVAVEHGHVVGVMTDGDVRRAMQTMRDSFFELTVGQIMSRSPILVRDTDKLTRAEDLMREHGVHSLAVVDTNDQFVGVIDYLTFMTT